jgi:hypothetical protein
MYNAAGVKIAAFYGLKNNRVFWKTSDTGSAFGGGIRIEKSNYLSEIIRPPYNNKKQEGLL